MKTSQLHLRWYEVRFEGVSPVRVRRSPPFGCIIGSTNFAKFAEQPRAIVEAMYQVAPHPIRRNFSSAGAFTAPANWPSAALHEPLLMLADLESRLRSSGGLLNADCLVGVLHGRVSQPISHVARMVVSRQLVHLTFARTIWLPAFQFNPGFDTLREGISEVLRELTPVLDDLELANWFAQPNIELDYLLPAEVLPLYPDEVRQAARLYRFVVKAS